MWTLRNLIRAGDLVTASTYRTAETSTDKLRAEKAEKKRLTLGVRVQDVDTLVEQISNRTPLWCAVCGASVRPSWSTGSRN